MDAIQFLETKANTGTMYPRIIFSLAISLAVLAVVLLAVFSPVAHRSRHPRTPTRPWLALSLYLQQPTIQGPPAQPVAHPDTRAFIFHRTLTERPENTSRPVGKAQGFIVSNEIFAHSDFNIIYLTFVTEEYSGSVSVRAVRGADGADEELTVVGGTGAFAFARGRAVFAQTDKKKSEVDTAYHVLGARIKRGPRWRAIQHLAPSVRSVQKVMGRPRKCCIDTGMQAAFGASLLLMKLITRLKEMRETYGKQVCHSCDVHGTVHPRAVQRFG